jgi:hypothetical protein
MGVLVIVSSVGCHPAGRAVAGYQEQLDRILNEYRRLPQTPEVQRLVELDRELDTVAAKIRTAHGRDKYDCFARYTTKEPYDGQMRNARSAAIRYLEKAMGMNPRGERNDYRREVLKSVESGDSHEWHWCAD